MELTERARSRAFIADQENWPRWPLLPMKLMSSNPRAGYLSAGQAVRATSEQSFDLTIVNFRGEVTEFRNFASLDEMFDRGWKID